MNNFLKIIGLVVGIFVVGGLIGWVVTRPSEPASPVPPPIETAPIPAKTNPVPSVLPSEPSRPRPTFMASNYGTLTKSTSLTQSPVALTVATNLVTNWEEKLNDILGSKQNETRKARELLEIFPRVPPDGQEELAQHLSNLVSDDQYSELGQHLTNSALPEAVLDVLLSDALNRPNRLKLPALVGVARDPRNPKASEAKDLLELFLEEDYGNDWDRWQQKVEDWLTQNPN